MTVERPIAIAFGTRPEIIKLAPIIRKFQDEDLSFVLIHSNQHYNHGMDKVFFEELSLPVPDVNLNVGSGGHAEQTAKILVGVERAMLQARPAALVVQGDTNTTLAASVAAAKIHVPVCHVEAGLRSGDRSMPEEINRILSDHCSDLLFAPTVFAEENLMKEGISEAKILVTGNTVVDALRTHSALAERSRILERVGLSRRSYFLATLHRAENVDNPTRLSSIIKALQRLREKFSLDVVLPIHPRTRKNVETAHISLEGIKILDPAGYFDFLHLENNASVILTDSGGVQEEACVLQVPCVTLRDNTERPETVEIGANVLAGSEPSKIIESASIMLQRKISWMNPFGDGRSSERILACIAKNFELQRRQSVPLR